MFYSYTSTVVHPGFERFTGEVCSEIVILVRVDSPVPTECIGGYHTPTWSYMLGLFVLL